MLINDGICIGVERPARWYVDVTGIQFDLHDIRDFFRVSLLLERPYAEAKSALEVVAREAGATEAFPMWKVVACAFESRSANNADLAVTWLPSLDDEELVLLSELLGEVQNARWARQHARQMARKFQKRVSARRGKEAGAP